MEPDAVKSPEAHAPEALEEQLPHVVNEAYAAQELAAEAAAAGVDKGAALTKYVMGHVKDGHEWHLPGLHLHLPEWLSLHATMLVIGSIIVFGLFMLLYNRKARVPRGITNLLETLVLFVRDDICISNMGAEDGRKYAPLFLTFFFFILTLNLMGLVPVFVTATGNVSVTLGLSSITLLVMIFGAIAKNGVGGFCSAFVPHGVPAPVLLLLVPIEFMGMFIKAFALTIRLFANLLAGHISLFCIIGLMYVVGTVAFPAIVMATGIYLLEIFVAFLQTYVFTLLSAMFVGLMLNPEH